MQKKYTLEGCHPMGIYLSFAYQERIWNMVDRKHYKTYELLDPEWSEVLLGLSSNDSFDESTVYERTTKEYSGRVERLDIEPYFCYTTLRMRSRK